MKKQQLETLTTDELRKKQRLYNLIIYALITLMLLYGSVMFYLMFTGGWEAQNPFIATPFFLFAIMMLINSANSKVLSEIKRREENK